MVSFLLCLAFLVKLPTVHKTTRNCVYPTKELDCIQLKNKYVYTLCILTIQIYSHVNITTYLLIKYFWWMKSHKIFGKLLLIRKKVFRKLLMIINREDVPSWKGVDLFFTNLVLPMPSTNSIFSDPTQQKPKDGRCGWVGSFSVMISGT